MMYSMILIPFFIFFAIIFILLFYFVKDYKKTLKQIEENDKEWKRIDSMINKSKW